MKSRRSYGLAWLALTGCFNPDAADDSEGSASGTDTSTTMVGTTSPTSLGTATSLTSDGSTQASSTSNATTTSATSSDDDGTTSQDDSTTAEQASISSTDSDGEESSSGLDPTPAMTARFEVDGIRVTVQLDITDADGDLQDAVIVWGDSSADTIRPTEGFIATAVTHDYDQLDTFTVVITARDEAGHPAVATEDVTIGVPADAELEYLMDTTPSEEVPDTSGNGRHGQADIGDNCTDVDSDRHGLANRAYRFNDGGGSCGLDAFGRINAPPVPHTSEFAFSIWMAPNNRDDVFVMGESSDATEFEGTWARLILGQWGGLGASGQQVSFVVEDAGGDAYLVTDPDAVPSDGATWTHFAAIVSFDGTESTATLYRNGESVGVPVTLTGTLNNPSPDDPFMFADSSPDGNRGFRGLLDDARVYDRALTPFEVAALLLE